MNGWKLCYPPIIHLFAKQNSKGANSMKGKKKILVFSILKIGQSRKYSFLRTRSLLKSFFLNLQRIRASDWLKAQIRFTNSSIVILGIAMI